MQIQKNCPFSDNYSVFQIPANDKHRWLKSSVGAVDLGMYYNV
jgi:hypothetical protein